MFFLARADNDAARSPQRLHVGFLDRARSTRRPSASRCRCNTWSGRSLRRRLDHRHRRRSHLLLGACLLPNLFFNCNFRCDRVSRFLTRTFQSQPFANLLAIVIRQIQYLNSRPLARLRGPYRAHWHFDGIRYAIETNGNTIHRVPLQPHRRRYQEAVLAQIQQHAQIVRAKGNINRPGGIVPGIKTPLTPRIECCQMISRRGHSFNLPYARGESQTFRDALIIIINARLSLAGGLSFGLISRRIRGVVSSKRTRRR